MFNFLSSAVTQGMYPDISHIPVCSPGVYSSPKNNKMKEHLCKIKNIIFDLGNVLLDLDFNASVEAFSKLGLSEEVVDYRQAYANPVFYEFEKGTIEPAAFRSRVRKILNNPRATDKEIDDAWCAIFLDIPEKRVRALQRLAKKYDIFLFSNTNKIHIEQLHREFKAIYGIEFSSLFTDDYYSHLIGERKPDLRSYRKVIELSGVRPEDTLFVDDLEKNITGARKAGLKTFWLKEGMEMTDFF